MANKIIQLKDGNDNLYPSSLYEDVSVTLSTTQYSGYYYADGSASHGGVTSISVIDATSNRPAFAQMISSTGFRVFGAVASTVVKVRITY